MGTDWYLLSRGRCRKTETNLLPMIKLDEMVLDGKDARTHKSERLSGQRIVAFILLALLWAERISRCVNK